MHNEANADASDLLALFAEVTAPGYVPDADVAAKIAAYNAETARIATKAPPAAHERCGKCCGTGHIPEFRHIAGGDCFDCCGTGRA